MHACQQLSFDAKYWKISFKPTTNEMDIKTTGKKIKFGNNEKFEIPSKEKIPVKIYACQ